MPETLYCPDCGETINATFEHMYAWADTTDVQVDDEGEFTYEHFGNTEVLWDTQETLGVGCMHCGWVNVHTHFGTVKERVITLLVPTKDEVVAIEFNLDEIDEPQSFTIDPEKGVIIPTEVLPQETS